MNKFAVEHAAGGVAPYIRLTLGGETGLFLIDYGASSSVIEKGIWVTPNNDPNWVQYEEARKFRLGPFTLPGWSQGAEFLVEQRDIYLDPSRRTNRQHGVLGVDLFVNQIVEFHYSATQKLVYVSDYPAPECPAKLLQESSLVRLEQREHWAEGTVAPDGIHNGPVLYGRFGSSSSSFEDVFSGQLDTGYDDIRYKYTIVANEVLQQKLLAKGVRLVRVSDVRTHTCKGDLDSTVYSAEGFTLTNSRGEPIRRLQTVHVVAAKDNGCGGISGSSEPAAQFAASFLEAIGQTVVVGPRKEVWVASMTVAAGAATGGRQP